MLTTTVSRKCRSIKKANSFTRNLESRHPKDSIVEATDRMSAGPLWWGPELRREDKEGEI